MFSSLERKHYIWATAALIVFIAVLGIISFIIAPRTAHTKMMDTLGRAGFNTTFIKKPRIAYGAMLYEDVAFDEDAFSTVKYIKVTYNPFMLVLAGKFHDIDIIDMNLTGEWATDALESLTFTGWKAPHDIGHVPLASFDHINISKSRVSLLTQKAGVFSVFFDGTTSRSGNKTEFQTNLKSEQKYLSLTTSGSGAIEGARWYADIEILDGKFEDPAGDFRATRLSGWFNLSYPVNEPFKIMSQLRAGGITIYGLPWQAASSTIDFSGNALKIFTEAKSVGYDGLELEANLFRKSGAGIATGGSVHAETPSAFYDYFGAREGFKNFLKDLEPYKTGSGLSVDYLITGERALRYEIKQNGQSTGVFGNATLPETPKEELKP
jgi:hypothetical protein